MTGDLVFPNPTTGKRMMGPSMTPWRDGIVILLYTDFEHLSRFRRRPDRRTPRGR